MSMVAIKIDAGTSHLNCNVNFLPFLLKKQFNGTNLELKKKCRVPCYLGRRFTILQQKNPQSQVQMD